jgi:hypothetical protein
VTLVARDTQATKRVKVVVVVVAMGLLQEKALLP